MSKFIEVVRESDNEKVLINLDYIFKVERFEEETSAIYLKAEDYHGNHIQQIIINHSYSDIKKMLMVD